LNLSKLSFASGNKDETPLYLKLSNDVHMPLIGCGIGNLQHELIQETFPSALAEQYKIFDTASASKNEFIVGDQISDYGERKRNESAMRDIHIVTKVWYTHLGYERTKLSVMQSLYDLGPYAKVHMLLHWPKCDNRIEWMNCKEEEANLPNDVKEAGPSPLLNPYGENAAWKGSWKALEELYMSEDQIVSIGVSNFSTQDMEELLQVCTITPHLYQGNVAWIFTEPHLVNILRENNIAFQAFNVMHTFFSNLHDRPWARHHFERISLEISKHDDVVSWPRLVIAFLIQNNISVVIRASDKMHLRENSPLSVRKVPRLNEQHTHEMMEIIDALSRGKDVPKPAELEGKNVSVPQTVQATFRNLLRDHVDLFWVHEETGEHVNVANSVKPATANTITTYPGHKFVAKRLNGQEFNFQISHDSGHDHFFSIEL